MRSSGEPARKFDRFMYCRIDDVCDRVLKLADRSDNQISLPFSRIRIVGEYTNEDGPYAADHFLLLVTAERDVYVIESESLDESTVESLCELTNSDLSFSLLGGTTFASRCIWPREVLDSQVIRFIDRSPMSMELRLRDELFQS